MTTGDLFGEAEERLFDFLGSHPPRPTIEPKVIARFIACWISRAYATKAIALMGAQSPTALLEQLHYRYQISLPKDVRQDFDRGSNSKLFYRMLTSGSPDIRDDLRTRSLNGQLCALIDDPRKELTALLQAPFWRLIDPAALSNAERTRFSEWVSRNRVERAIPRGLRSTWRARLAALSGRTRLETCAQDASHPLGGAFALITEALLELHLAREANSYARYAVALDAVLELSASSAHWLLELLAAPSPVTGWKDFNLQRYLKSAFGVLSLTATSTDCCIAIDEARLAGMRISYEGLEDSVEHYSCAMDYDCQPGNIDVDWDDEMDSEIFRIATCDAQLAMGEKQIDVSLCELAEINAALFGYPAYAELISDGRNSPPNTFLDDATFLVMNRPFALARAESLISHLAAETISAVVDECIFSISTGSAPISVCESVEDLYLTWARSEIKTAIEQSVGVHDGRSRLSAFVMEDTFLQGSDLWQSELEWRMDARATAHEIDDHGSPLREGILYVGQGHVVFSKAGRGGLNVEASFGCVDRFVAVACSGTDAVPCCAGAGAEAVSASQNASQG